MTRWAAFAIALVAILAGCAPAGPGLPSIPSEPEARAHLERVVALVAADEASRICELGSGTCHQLLRNGDPAAIPRTAPVVIGTRVIETSVSGDQMSIGGRVLQLCGIDGLGQAYASELLVFHAENGLISTGTPYWLGTRIADSPTTGDDTTAGACPSLRP